MDATADLRPDRSAFRGVRPMILLFRREIAAKLVSPWLYLVASVVCLMAWVYGFGFQNTFRTESVLVTTDPLLGLNVTIVAFLALVLGLRLSTAVSWEREHGTLDVLLAGPMGWRAIVAAKFLVEVCVLALIIAVYLLYLLVAQPLGAGVIAPAENAPAALLIVFALPLMALGLLISAAAATVRAAVVIFLVVIGLLAAFEAARMVLQALPAETMSLTLLYVRTGLEAVSPVLRPISAVAQLANLSEAVTRQAPPQGAQIIASCGLTAVTLLLAYVVAIRRGVS